MTRKRLDRRSFGKFTGGAFAAAAVTQSAGFAAAAEGRQKDIVLRPFAGPDRQAVLRLVENDYAGGDAEISSLATIVRALHLSGGAGEDWRKTIVAERAGQVIGVASAKEQSVHQSARVHVIVDASYRRRGVGTRLYRSISGEAQERELAVTATILGSEDAAWLFAEACGMRPLMHARQIRVLPQSWALDLWSQRARADSAEFHLKSGAEFPLETLYGAIADAYHEMHRRWISTRRLDPAEAVRLWAPAIPPDLAVLAANGDAIIGSAALIAKNDERAVLFPAAPCSPLADVRMERRLVAGLLADRLIAARMAGYAEVLIESDEDDGRMLEVLGSVPASGLIEIYTLTAAPTGYWPRSLS